MRVLRIEPKASCMLGKHLSINWVTSLALYSIFLLTLLTMSIDVLSQAFVTENTAKVVTVVP